MKYNLFMKFHFREIRQALKADVEDIQKAHPSFQPGLAIVQVNKHDGPMPGY
jgi:5,10-methylene-tetrahydrofolate dehydrogenase/methenyl tetrahydrofolate cyclohydrolase